ncbi:ankyrin repeat domain-containing protein 17-like [Haliotis rufescens]|uniref:ankyrin repeat domain-containing protein 17-like n=1 Tax=Haliotis rufescens TaxID=6454 RepID=UPI00201EB225|nr:ankyrin repeat domain-containing protein 17-like [Haliotis rufescens]
MLAAGKGHRELVELLARKRANVSLVNRLDNNILHSACLGGDVEVVMYVLSQDIVNNNGRVWCGTTPVMLAEENGHRVVVELLVNEGADVTHVDKKSHNLLHCASRGGHVELVKYVLSLGMLSINSRGWKNFTPVLLAAEKGHKEVVELLVSKGADVSLVYDGGNNILCLASREGHEEMVKYVMDMVSINSRCWNKMTPVMLAAEKGHKDVVELLVSKGADVSLSDKRGNNLLHFASRGGQVEVVKYVLSLGRLSINSRGWKKMTPVMLAAEKGHKEVVEVLVSKGANVSLVYDGGNNILCLASRKGHEEVVKYVMDMVSINSRCWNKMTPVMLAAGKGHKEVVELLVSKGADVSLSDKRGDNLLHFASREGHEEVVKFVLSQDMVSINSRGWKKITPAMTAAEKGHKEVVELLVSKGADVSFSDKRGNNLLHLASQGGQVEVVKYVLSLGRLSINSRGWKKMTPVMLAAAKGHKEVVEVLVSKGANVSLVYDGGNNILCLASREGHEEVVKYVMDMVSINSRCWNKMTPVMLAAEKGHEEVVELLVSKGADLSLSDIGGDTILHFACRGGNVEVVKFVLSQDMVNINARNSKRQTAANKATSRGRRDIIDLLVSHGAQMY